MEKRVRINSNELQLGMCVIDLDRPWLETPFLFQGFTISSSADIQVVQQYCKFVYIDTNRGASPNKAKKTEETKAGTSLFKLFTRTEHAAASLPVEKELSTARAVHGKTSTLVRSFMDDVRLGRALNVENIEASVTDIVDSLLRNPDAMLWLSQLKDKSIQEEQHAVNCCILAVAFGRHLGLPRDELLKLGVSALLHDVGKLQVPDTIQKATHALSENEWAIMRKHPEFSRAILLTARGLYPGAIDVAHTHHEWINGSGYPRGINGNQIAPFAKMVAIVDSYDHMVREHIYRPENSAFEALRELHQGKGKQFDESLVKRFIDMIGVFPIGSVIELNNGEIGVVVGGNPAQPTQPRVLMLLDKARAARREQIINLAGVSAIHNGEPLRIIRVLRKGDYGIDQAGLHARALQFAPPA